MDVTLKLKPNIDATISQLEYSGVIGSLMYVMTCSRPNITFVAAKLSWYTSNLGHVHCEAIRRVLSCL